MAEFKHRLNVASIAGLWTTYIADSAAICILEHWHNHVDMKEAKKLIKEAKNLAEKHLDEIQIIFNKEEIPTPNAFGNQDVNLNAPRLFTDAFYLFYLATMFGFGLDGYALMLRYIARKDIMQFFRKRLDESADFLTRVEMLRQEKGIYVTAPQCEVSKQVSYIEKNNFMAGFSGQSRPLLAREATNVFAGALIDVFMRALLMGFGQVASSKQVKDYMYKGVELASRHFGNFGEILNNENIPVPSISDDFVTDSTISPFSDKLMMFQILTGTQFAIGVDGAAIASSMRSDLVSLHTKYGAEIVKFASDGVNIMISNGWMEQPPQIVLHRSLSRV